MSPEERFKLLKFSST
ncbi:MAG TPA: hypothetical protein DHW82_05850 [Spirochaetia bacterium]|nr:hypothetical protein [Spirochaetia bacterium]